MVTTTRPLPRPRAFTIIESVVVLAILVVLTMVVLALYNYEMKPGQRQDKTSSAPRSLPTVNVPGEPVPSEADEGDMK